MWPYKGVKEEDDIWLSGPESSENSRVCAMGTPLLLMLALQLKLFNNSNNLRSHIIACPK